MNALDIHHVTKIFGKGKTAVKAVNDACLHVRRGEVAYVMGPSGSGKTTLLSMIGGLLKPTSGSIKIDGVEITKLGEGDLPRIRREKVGFVFQAFNLMQSLTASENVQVALNLTGAKGKAAEQRANQLLATLGLKKKLEFLPKQLSGGEQQRVAIARALANNPAIILADEPTGNLDSTNGRIIMCLLYRIVKEQKKSAVIVSHDPRIESIADLVFVMEDGKLKKKSKNKLIKS